MTVPAHVSSNPYFRGSDVLTPDMKARSIKVLRRKSSARSDPDTAEVYNFDMEPDDLALLKTLQPVLSTLSKQSSKDGPRMVLIAGQHMKERDTFKDLVKNTARLTGATDGLTRVTDDRAEVGAVTVIRGAPFRIKKDSEKSRLATEAGERVASALENRKYAWYNMTSAVLFSTLAPETQDNCQTLSFTCGPILGTKGPTTGANQFWDADAHTKMVNDCATADVPVDYVHPSLLGISQQNLSDLPNWASIFRDPVDEDRGQQMRDAGRVSMGKVAEWIGRSFGAYSNQSGTAVSDHMTKLIDEQVKQNEPSDAILESMKLWSEKACSATAYEVDDCSLDGPFPAGRRATTIAHTLGCILNGSLADLAVAASPDTIMYVPLAIDNGYTKRPGTSSNDGKKQEQIERPPRITLDGSKDAPLMAVSRDPEAAWQSIVAKYEAGRKWEEDFRAEHGSTWTGPIDGDLAKGWEMYLPAMSTLLGKTISLASQRLSDEDLQKTLPEEQRSYEKKDYEALCEALRNLLSEENPMTQVCRELRDSASGA